jgi:hypothetical protein
LSFIAKNLISIHRYDNQAMPNVIDDHSRRGKRPQPIEAW